MFDARVLDQFSGAVECIYQAALDPGRWPVAVERVANLHGSDKALLFTPVLAPDRGGFAFPHGISQTAMLDWGTRYIDHDLWTQAGMTRNLTAGEAVIDTDLVPDSLLLESRFFREFLIHHDIRRLCTGMVFDGRAGEMPMTGCSVYGPPKAEPFGERNRQLHRLTLNHMSRSLGTMLRLRDTELRLASTLAALDRLDGGVLLLDRSGAVLFANVAARQILDAADGLSLRRGSPLVPGEGRLHAFNGQDNERLRRELTAIADSDPTRVPHFNHGLKLLRPSGRRELVLQLAPLAETGELAHADRHAHSIAFLSDPDRAAAMDGALMERLYGVTRAEVRLARELLGGDGLPEIARRLGLSNNTLKTQLQSLFAKTRTHRQADLVRLLMSLSLHT